MYEGGEDLKLLTKDEVRERFMFLFDALRQHTEIDFKDWKCTYAIAGSTGLTKMRDVYYKDTFIVIVKDVHIWIQSIKSTGQYSVKVVGMPPWKFRTSGNRFAFKEQIAGTNLYLILSVITEAVLEHNSNAYVTQDPDN